MKKLILVLAAASAALAFQPPKDQELARWKQQARNVSIIRDDWGIAHVYGKTDADAVFGMEYAQAEDDFNRVETNYINAMGRLAEAEGERALYQDLRMKLFIDPVELKKEYAASPAWLRTLMNAFADGLNFYLAEHPEVKPRVIKRFEPWMAMSFTEGSIGGDIEKVNLNQLAAFYGKVAVSPPPAEEEFEPEPTGSNGMAIAPANTVDHHALLLINPHTSFYFRSELQMVSDQGLDAYGAVTWGQFFCYQGFNDHAGWMHTSSGVDAVDEYLETVTKKGDGYVYKYGSEERPVTAQEIDLVRALFADDAVFESGDIRLQGLDAICGYYLANTFTYADFRLAPRTPTFDGTRMEVDIDVHLGGAGHTVHDVFETDGTRITALRVSGFEEALRDARQ